MWTGTLLEKSILPVCQSTGQSCPSDWSVQTSPVRGCAEASSQCSSAFSGDINTAYSKVCGRIIGEGVFSPDSFIQFQQGQKLLKGTILIVRWSNSPVNVYPHYPPPGLPEVRPCRKFDISLSKSLYLDARFLIKSPYFRYSIVSSTTDLWLSDHSQT